MKALFIGRVFCLWTRLLFSHHIIAQEKDKRRCCAVLTKFWIKVVLHSFQQEETEELRRELETYNPSFFEELEDLKYNYKEEVKKNIILEERLKQLCEESGIQDSSG